MSWCQDSTKVLIDIDAIRAANLKLAEREYLIEVNRAKDSIIVFKDSYINEQDRIIKDFQSKINDVNKINDSMNKRLERDKIIIGVSAGAATAAIVTSIILGVIKR